MKAFGSAINKRVERIKGICFSNQIHIDIAVNTKRYIDTNFDKKISLFRNKPL